MRHFASARTHRKVKRLITVGRFCIGTTQVDLDAALEYGIPMPVAWPNLASGSTHGLG